MSEQSNGQVSTLKRPTTHDRNNWQAYWEQQGQPWRTEPEIDIERQKYLEERRAITPDVQRGIFPFKNVELSRADIEWLLITHDNGRGAIDWNTESQPDPYFARKGLDFRGANLSNMGLQNLPLARLVGDLLEHGSLTDVQREAGTLHLEGANLAYAHLEGSNLANAHLEGTVLYGTYLDNAILSYAHLERANLNGARLDRASLYDAHLEGASLSAHMEGTKLSGARLDNANLSGAQLRRANLCESHLEGADLTLAHLESAYLARCFLDDATKLDKVSLGSNKDGFACLVDIHWRGVNLAVVDWTSVLVVGDEPAYEKRKWLHRRQKSRTSPVINYPNAIRAYRQLAVVLRDQGLNEDAARFAYRAQLCQRIVLRRQKKLGQYLFSLFLDALAGYGYRPGRSVAWYIATILVFALAYHFLGDLSLYPPDAFVFSVMSFHGRGFFPALSQETNLHNPLVMLAALEAIVGLLIEISFIATFTQRFFGK